MGEAVVAVDVGTGSARAGVFGMDGTLLGRAEDPIAMNRSDAEHAEHNSSQIWQAVGTAVRAAMAQAGIAPEAVIGISFDATCSLVVRDAEGRQLSVSTNGAREWDTIVWLDHRAQAEARECSASGHRVLEYLGGVMSPEMEIPKLMWLKRHLPQTWAQAGYFFDLADFLTYMASGSLARSQSTLTCKWTWLGHERVGWQDDFLGAMDLKDLRVRGRLPERASPAGTDLGPLTPAAAADLGLTTSCRVGAGVIDAHAGALGALGAHMGGPTAIDRHLGLITGTSNSVLALAPVPRPIAGVWGPYFGAILPDCWLSEAGQSATGALLDHVIRWHGAGGIPDGATHQKIAARITELRATEGASFARRLHVLPDFHGSRSPRADPDALGAISGLTLDSDFDSLCRLYWRTAVAIALGVRQILETLANNGFGIETLHVTGGHARNRVLMELYADATGRTVIESKATEVTLLGTAMIAATAGGRYPSLVAAAKAMHQGEHTRAPRAQFASALERDYRVLLEMQRQRQEIDAMG